MLAHEKLDFLGVNLKTVEDFNSLLISHLKPINHLEPINPASGNNYIFETGIYLFRKKCINFFRLMDPKTHIEEKPPEPVETYSFPTLILPSGVSSVMTIIDSYEVKKGTLLPEFQKLPAIVKLFSSDFENLKAISSKFNPSSSSSSYRKFNTAINCLGTYCFDNDANFLNSFEYLFYLPNELSEPFFKILGFSKLKEREMLLLEDLERGYLRRLIMNHLLLLFLKKT